MNDDLEEVLKKPVDELDKEDVATLRKVAATPGVDDVLGKPMDELEKEDEDTLEEAKEKLPRKKKLADNVVVLGKDESHVDQLPNAKPLKHTVTKGETLKEISEMYDISYGELSNHLMQVEGTTSLFAGQEIEIPRHFIDFSKAM